MKDRFASLTTSLNEITEKIIGCAIEVHRQLGPGLLSGPLGRILEKSLCLRVSVAERLL